MDEEAVTELLTTLSVEEQAIIRPVLERDLEFQQRERLRLQELKEHVEKRYSLLSSKSQESVASSMSTSISPSSPSFRGCVVCQTKLGFILNSGAKCRRCDQLVCDNCRCFLKPDDKSMWLCHPCFHERELMAASGEWASGGELVSEQLLTQMRKISSDRSRAASAMEAVDHQRHPRMSRRNMTLPSLPVRPFLCVPTEAEATHNQRRDATRRFWGGSPSPRSPSPRPLSAGPAGVVVIAPTPPPNSLIPELHPREVIGSPAPRSAPPSFVPSPVTPSMMLPLTEVEAPTPTSVQPSPVAEMRRFQFGNTKSYRSISRTETWEPHLLLPVDPREPRSRPLKSSGSDPLLLDDEWIPYKASISSQGSRGSSDFLNNNDSRRPSSVSTTSTLRRIRKMRKSSSRDTESTYSGCEFRDAASQASVHPTFVGEVSVTCFYDPATAILRIVVSQCRNLPHFGRYRPNPYVKLNLSGENGQERGLRQKTTTRYNAVDPLYGESLMFTHLSKSSLEQRKLSIAVWHRERFTRNALMGEAILWLRDVRWHQPSPTWLPLKAADSPDKAMAASLKLRLSFRVRDHERGIGMLRITLLGVDPKLKHDVSVQVSLNLRGELLFRRRGHLRSTLPWSWTAEFPEINIHDLHLRNARLRFYRRCGLWKYKRLAEVHLNAFGHNVARRAGSPCRCVGCLPWTRLTERPYKEQIVNLPLVFKK